jgi:hypothetical protein
MARPRLLLLSLALSLFAPSSTQAHIRLDFPPPRDTGLKSAPCGTYQSVRGPVTTTFQAGETISVVWQEIIGHPGHYRISFDDDGDDGFVDPTGFDDVSGGPNVLIDGIPDKTGTEMYEQQITLPNVACNNCTLQLIQVMTDKVPWGDGNDIYYQCADIVLVESPDAGVLDAGAADGGVVDVQGDAPTDGSEPDDGGTSIDSTQKDPLLDDSSEEGGCSMTRPGASPSALPLWTWVPAIGFTLT